jgi:phage tail sheath protein FI
MSSVTSSYLDRKTPGVYATQIATSGNAIVGVPTAEPVFIGYTEFAGNPATGASLYDTVIAISSMSEFQQYFGGAAPAPFTVAVLGSAGSPGSGAVAPVVAPAFSALYTSAPGQAAKMTPFSLTSAAAPGEPGQFNLFRSMQMFFANGGGICFVVSVGSYWLQERPTAAPAPALVARALASIQSADLVRGIEAASLAIGPTMIVVPEACQLPVAGYNMVVDAMLQQAATLQDRVALIDLPRCQQLCTIEGLQAAQTALANAIAPQVAYASYGVAYAPALITTAVTPSGILFTNLAAADDPAGNATMNNILTAQAVNLHKLNVAMLETVQCAISAAFPLPSSLASDNTPMYSGTSTSVVNGGTAYPQAPAAGPALAAWQRTLNTYLLNALPVFGQIEQLIANAMNVLPPSGLLAGVYAKSDALNGVWNAPANIALASVSAPLYVMTDAQQAGFNLPLNGQAIDIIRSQPSRGSVVWGERTLDGNSEDYRYVRVRRTLIYIEQSIKRALQSVAFAANDSTTWSSVTSSISTFLTELWQSGGLMGANASEAFTVQCGLGSTMTSQDILDGYMIAAVTLQMIRPAEFIELTFKQKVAG